MPTRTIDTQTFEGETIQCAKFVSDEPFSWKAAQIVQAETDYEFQMVAKSSVATSLTIQVGDTVKTQAITTDFTRFVIPFPSVTNDVDSLYITFPSGTYWLYNLQLERASTPSAWRPAPEDAEDYADKAAQQAVDDQTQLDVFNKLTNNGASQGIYLLDGQLYINGEYIAANTLSANKIHGGTIDGTDVNIINLNASNITSGTISASKISGGSMSASVITSGTMSADRISGGTIDANDVTINNLNASKITSGTISASKVTGGTLSGSQININNGTFAVDSSGNVTANSLSSSNASITGGSINIVGSSSTQDKVILSYGNFTTNISPGAVKVGNTNLGTMAQIANGTIGLITDTSTNKTGFNVTNAGTLTLSNPGGTQRVQLAATNNSVILYDSNGTRRVLLNTNGLYFYNASGTLTKTYSAT